mgnify:FL=1
MPRLTCLVALTVSTLLGSHSYAEQPPSECFGNSPPSVAFLYEGSGGIQLWREGRYPASTNDRACFVLSACHWPLPKIGAGFNQLLVNCSSSRKAGREVGPTTIINYCETSSNVAEGLQLITTVSKELISGAACGQHFEFDGPAENTFVGALSVENACLLVFVRLSDLGQGALITPAACQTIPKDSLGDLSSQLFQDSKLWLAARSTDGRINVSLTLTQSGSSLQVDGAKSRFWGQIANGSPEIRSWLVAISSAANSKAPLPPPPDSLFPNAQSIAPPSRALKFLFAGIVGLSSKPFSDSWYSLTALSARRW